MVSVLWPCVGRVAPFNCVLQYRIRHQVFRCRGAWWTVWVLWAYVRRGASRFESRSWYGPMLRGGRLPLELIVKLGGPALIAYIELYGDHDESGVLLQLACHSLKSEDVSEARGPAIIAYLDLYSDHDMFRCLLAAYVPLPPVTSCMLPRQLMPKGCRDETFHRAAVQRWHAS